VSHVSLTDRGDRFPGRCRHTIADERTTAMVMLAEQYAYALIRGWLAEVVGSFHRKCPLARDNAGV
jgi:hypothetical protein